MQWLNEVVGLIIKTKPDGEVVVSSGVSPSGTYHLGTLREILTAEAVARELRFRGRKVRHIHFVDDLDALRKVPAGVPAEFKKYLGQPLCDVPSPDAQAKSYADFYLADLLAAQGKLRIDMEVVRSHEKYRAGFFVPAIEATLDKMDSVRQAMEEVAGRKLDPNWSPIQVTEDGYLKSRKFLAINKQDQTVGYQDLAGNTQTIGYNDGQVKLDWRVDWPARWWLLKVDFEPFGRDHATAGGSYDTGAAIIKETFGGQPPIPLPYEFINRSGQTKKMSKSAGETISLSHLLEVLPTEVIWYFILRFPAGKQLYFDEGDGVVKLIDDFAQVLAKKDKTTEQEQLVRLSTDGQPVNTVSNIPFSHLVSSYQAALKDPADTLGVLERTEYAQDVKEQGPIIEKELLFIDRWLAKWAEDDVKFELMQKVDPEKFNQAEKNYLSRLADAMAKEPADADGDTLHKVIYQFKQTDGFTPEQLFVPLYRCLIGKSSGPRAGWFLSILPREWLLKRLRLEE
ncbi:lysine--tRNA ligase [Candidatus Saccharibacteria bacterium RIFCSPHIGHO2_12_FULL_48_21]|nr:MAG: lysine--tRNA ligase [Candidatus Saccharibacteria bacterium RIFCSPHIGHO2_12_FULL_48_21]